MDWWRLKNQGYIEIDGTRYDLGHLEKFEFPFSIPATGRLPRVTGNVIVRFSCHCISAGAQHGQTLDFNQIGQEFKIVENDGRERRFSLSRYALSHQLLDIVHSLPGGRDCFFNGREKWVTVKVQNKGGEIVDYQMYFSLRYASSNTLLLFVESAFIPERNRQVVRRRRMKRRGKVRGSTLFAKTLRRESIISPPRR